MAFAILSVPILNQSSLSYQSCFFTGGTPSWRSGSERSFIRPRFQRFASLSSSSPSPPTSLSEDGPSPSPEEIRVQAEEAVEGYEKLTSGGCTACGRDELERGCNGEGRVQGGIATLPGFGWWPIKAYRPCPGFLESGGRYRRQGQSMDEVAFGRGERAASAESSGKVKRERAK